MARTIASAEDLTRLNTVQPSMAKAEIRVNRVVGAEDTVDDARVLSLIALAIRRADLKQEALAHRAGVKPSQYSSALNGHGGFNVRWLWSHPSAFWNEFLPLLRAEKEQTEAAQRLQRKEHLVRLIELLIVEVA